MNQSMELDLNDNIVIEYMLINTKSTNKHTHIYKKQNSFTDILGMKSDGDMTWTN